MLSSFRFPAFATQLRQSAQLPARVQLRVFALAEAVRVRLMRFPNRPARYRQAISESSFCASGFGSRHRVFIGITNPNASFGFVFIFVLIFIFLVIVVFIFIVISILFVIFIFA